MPTDVLISAMKLLSGNRNLVFWAIQRHSRLPDLNYLLEPLRPENFQISFRKILSIHESQGLYSPSGRWILNWKVDVPNLQKNGRISDFAINIESMECFTSFERLKFGFHP
jgi:hypothetical protein